VIELSRRAAAQLDSLLAPFSEKKRPEAMRNLLSALREARDAIQANPDGGLTAPRPYPTLARPGRHWLGSGRYWIAWRSRPVLKIVAVVYDQADIPNRV